MIKKKVPVEGTRFHPRNTGTGRRQFFTAVKRVLQARGLTYAQLAPRMGLSESGVKKLFSRKDCELSRLEDIAQAAGLTLAELLQAAERPPFERVELTEEQQLSLLHRPLLFDVFWKLTVERWSLPRVAEAFGLWDPELKKIIYELDRLDLIVVEQPGDRVRPRHGDLVQWLPRGPLLDHLHQRWGRDVQERARQGGTIRLHQLALRPDTLAELEAELARVLDAFLRRSRAEQLTSGASDAPPHGLLVALAEGSFVRPEPSKQLGTSGNQRAKNKPSPSRTLRT